jgi:hypothetical protein
MRTTLSLDDDVAALLTRVRKARKADFKTVVNEALRHGLAEMAAPKPPRKPYRTPSRDAGAFLVGDIDDVSEALVRAEGEAFR